MVGAAIHCQGEQFTAKLLWHEILKQEVQEDVVEGPIKSLTFIVGITKYSKGSESPQCSSSSTFWPVAITKVQERGRERGNYPINLGDLWSPKYRYFRATESR